jgi:hypothetical protein
MQYPAGPAFNDHAVVTRSVGDMRQMPVGKRYKQAGTMSTGPVALPSSFTDGGGLVQGEDMANSGSSMMTNMVHWPLQTRKVNRRTDSDWLGDLHTGMIVFVRACIDKTTYTDGLNRKKQYSQFDQRADVFALHQLNTILHRLSLGFDKATAERVIPANVFNEFQLGGVVTTDISESANGTYSVLNIKMQGDIAVTNVFGLGLDAGDWLQLVCKRVPVPESSTLVSFRAKTAVPEQLDNYHRESRERVRHVTQIVPMVTPTTYIPAKHMMSVLDSGDRFVVREMAKSWTLGQVWFRSKELGESTYATTKDNSYYFRQPLPRWFNGSKNAQAAMQCGDVFIKVNRA